MNLYLEELYKIRKAFNAAAVHGHIFINDPLILRVNKEIEEQEIGLHKDSIFDNFFKKTKLG